MPVVSSSGLIPDTPVAAAAFISSIILCNVTSKLSIDRVLPAIENVPVVIAVWRGSAFNLSPNVSPAPRPPGTRFFDDISDWVPIE